MMYRFCFILVLLTYHKFVFSQESVVYYKIPYTEIRDSALRSYLEERVLPINIRCNEKNNPLRHIWIFTEKLEENTFSLSIGRPHYIIESNSIKKNIQVTIVNNQLVYLILNRNYDYPFFSKSNFELTIGLSNFTTYSFEENTFWYFYLNEKSQFIDQASRIYTNKGVQKIDPPNNKIFQ